MNSITSKQVIAVLGAGSWGVTAARHLSEIGHDVCLWEHDAQAADQLTRNREIPDKLPGIRLPDSIKVTHDITVAVSRATAIVFVVPSTAIPVTADLVRSASTSAATIVSLTKGIDVESGERMTEIIAERLKRNDIVALVGPSHAEEVARDVPTALVAASADPSAAVRAQQLFTSERLRVYTSDDVIGVELGAALKNIVAIAAGIVDGLGYDSADNLKGALITRGLAEITRLGVRMRARPETFAGLSGIGDLVTTCLSRHSRNRHVGEQIGRGRTLADILAQMSMVAEGVNTTRAALRLAERLDVDMPIARAVGSVLFDGRAPRDALGELMARPLQPEIRR